MNKITAHKRYCNYEINKCLNNTTLYRVKALETTSGVKRSNYSVLDLKEIFSKMY